MADVDSPFSIATGREDHFTFKEEKISLKFERDEGKSLTILEWIVGPYTITFFLIIIGVFIWMFTSDMGNECISNIKNILEKVP